MISVLDMLRLRLDGSRRPEPSMPSFRRLQAGAGSPDSALPAPPFAPQDRLLRAGGGQIPFLPPIAENWGEQRDPSIYAAPRPPPAGDVVLPAGEPSPFADTTPRANPYDSILRTNQTGAPGFHPASAAAAPPADDMAWLGRALQGGEALQRPALPEGLPEVVRQSILNQPSYSEQSSIPARISPVDYSDFDQEYSGRNRSYERERLGRELDWQRRFPQMDFPVPEGAWATPTQQSPYASPLNQMMPLGRKAPLALY